MGGAERTPKIEGSAGLMTGMEDACRCVRRRGGGVCGCNCLQVSSPLVTLAS